MENRNLPTTPLPNPGEGGPVYSGEPGNTPAIPLPNPGEGGPVAPGPSIQPLPGGYIPLYPQAASVRLLNAACGYPPLSLYIGGAPAAGPLEAGSLSAFARVLPGRQTITITDSSGYIYLQTRLRLEGGERSTIAILLRAGGLELALIRED